MARSAARLAEEKLGQNIVIMDVRDQTTVTECFVFVGAASHLHVKSLEDTIRMGLKNTGAKLLRTDGQRGHLWRVLDYGSVMIHIMDQKTRDFYGVERLWDQSKKVSFALVAKKSFPAAKKPSPKKRTPKKKTGRSKK